MAVIALTVGVILSTQSCLNLPDPIAELKGIVKGEDKPVLEFDHYMVVSDDNDDLIVQQGETVTIQVTLKNTGNYNANNVQANFTTYNTFIYNLEPTTNIRFGNIQPDNSATAQTNLCFSVNNSTPPNTQISFIANVTDDKSNNWNLSFNVLVQQAILPPIPPEPVNEYNEHDVDKLKNFLKQNSSTERLTNGHKLGLTDSDVNNWENNEQWITKLQGVTWNDNTPKQINNINWIGKGIAGNLDLSECNELVNINLQTNEKQGEQNLITQLNLNNCTKLTSINCVNNQLTILTLDNCTQLTLLHCYDNQLTNLNLSNCTNLILMTCEGNPVLTMNVAWITPPNIELRLPSNLTQATLFVPQGSITSYQNTEPWNRFGTVSDGQDGQNPIVDNEYHEDDKNALRNFLSQNSTTAGQKNGHKLGLTTDDMNRWEDNEEWIPKVQGVSWNRNVPKQIGSISWHEKELVGNLDLEGCVAVTRLECGDNQLDNLNVSTCTELTSLDCDHNQLTRMDVSNCTKLTRLGCRYNQLIQIDVNNCTELTYLHSYDNQLTQVDVSNCRKLTSFGCGKNRLAQVDVSNCAALTYLSCSENQLNTLNVNVCTVLSELYCRDNQLTQLDASNCTALAYLDCSNNQLNDLNVNACTDLMYLDCRANQLNDLDVSRCTELTELYCLDNRLTQMNFIGCTKLTTLWSKNNPLSRLIVGWATPPTDNANISLPNASDATLYVPVGTRYLYQNVYPWNTFGTISDGTPGEPESPGVNNNYHDDDENTLRTFLQQNSAQYGQSNGQRLGLTTADMNAWETNENWVAKVEGVEWNNASPRRVVQINWEGKGLAGNLDMTGCTVLGFLNFYDNQVTALDISKNIALSTLRCEKNRLTSLDVSKNAALLTLSCHDNLLSALNVNNNTKLLWLNCFTNQFTELDVSNNTELTYLDCHNNRLNALDVNKNTKLTQLSCGHNQITLLDVSNNTNLTGLGGENNQITSLDTRHLTALKTLWCSDNQLTSIDVSKNTELTSLYCSNNRLTSLDISKNMAVTMLYCSGNPLTDLAVGWQIPIVDKTDASPGWFMHVTFSNVDLSRCTLRVPSGTRSLYQNADTWKNFGNIVEW